MKIKDIEIGKKYVVWMHKEEVLRAEKRSGDSIMFCIGSMEDHTFKGCWVRADESHLIRRPYEQTELKL